MLIFRFDMRAPGGAGIADLYAAALDMCAWAETRGAVLAVLSEHHGADDGHLPTPLLLASAIAARTTQLAILLAAVPLPLWDTVRLAEEMAVLDILSRGRVSYALGVGHRAEEYDLFGLDYRRRGAVADDQLPVLLALLRGQTVEHGGRTFRVTPQCATPGGPHVVIAGGSRAAARRAARHGLGFISQTADEGLVEYYESCCRAAGTTPGPVQLPVPGAPTAVFVADDVDKAWHEIGEYLLHDAIAAASYRPDDDTVASISRAGTVAELREPGGPYRILTEAEAVEYLRAGRPLPLLPLCGGMPPEIAWPYLERAAAASAAARQTT
ncbi:hypothetical protein MCHIJ_10840 [Mycolicibacterium chitae]|uniref:Luciferase family protein n=1 Tax=Mycolicibacterium chitae TaxID=1792 RepID=A0A3S4VFN9_MYCCI|nr:LLM class flavin-dependent oxidoreductase [Mycolicibacterium chitae]MCV7107555.1 LLM class flavin-dependent oxidoreductase [Mycolicibacterium chitae]BBZ01647.1 hypothetical protein MCHIJ_10840 [Mycolicibacterium chitae]VEG50484.1 luciferase family protein [Mycolicibacterium chitae]